MSGLERPDALPLLTDVRPPGDGDAETRDRRTLYQDPLAGRGAFPLAYQSQRDELARTERLEAEVIEPLLIGGKHDGASLEVDARDLVEIDGGEHQRPEYRRPQHGMLKQEIRHVGERRRHSKPAQPQDVPHRIRDQ